MTGLDSQKGSASPLECDLDLGHSGKFLRTGKVDQKDESWGHQVHITTGTAYYTY